MSTAARSRRALVVAISVLVVVVGGPLLVLGVSPDLRTRARVRWLGHVMRSSETEARRTARGRLLAIGRLAIDEVLPELVTDEVEEAVAVAGSGSLVAIVELDTSGGGGVHGERYFTVGSVLAGEAHPVLLVYQSQLRVERLRNLSALERLAGGHGLGVAKDTGRGGGELLLLAPLPDDLAPAILDAVKRKLPPG
jgi:hypothetical protein